MVVRQEPFGHGHRKIRNTCGFNEGPNAGVSLRVGGALAENDEWALSAREQVEGAIDRFRRRNLTGRRIDDAHERLFPGIGIECHTKNVRGQVEIDPARPARYGGMNGARDSNTDIFGLANPEGCLTPVGDARRFPIHRKLREGPYREILPRRMFAGRPIDREVLLLTRFSL